MQDVAHHLFFEIFADLVVDFEFTLDLFELFFVQISILDCVIGYRLRRTEKVEKGLGGFRLADQSRTVSRLKRRFSQNPRAYIHIKLTLISLFLDFKLFRKILVFLPLDLSSDRAIVNEISRVSHFVLVKIRLFESFIFEKLVLAKDELDFEAWFAFEFRVGLVIKISEANVDKMFQGFGVPIGDDIVQADVVSKGCEPEFRDGSGVGWRVFGQRGVLLVVLLRILLACLDFFLSGDGLTRDQGMPALVQGPLQAQIL